MIIRELKASSDKYYYKQVFDGQFRGFLIRSGLGGDVFGRLIETFFKLVFCHTQLTDLY